MSLYERVVQAAEAALEKDGSVGPLELFRNMGFLHPCHIECWRKGNEYYPALRPWIQVGPEKFEKSINYFQQWVEQRCLRPIEAAYTRRVPGGVQELRVTEDADPAWEKFYRIRYAPADLPEKKTARLTEKLQRPPDLVVFEMVSEAGKCSECGIELLQGDYLFKENNLLLCLACADLDHLVFLPAGDTALTRRARKCSPLAAVVVRFNRSRKRYERQGLLVAKTAISRAQDQCAADASERAIARVRAAIARTEEDRRFIDSLSQAIVARYPQCPPEEATAIAEHTGLRNSGRVGRSAAGRDLNSAAVDLAVIAHIRHTHTKYDELLMQGVDRLGARAQIREKIDEVIQCWRG
jgi:hypothetical protein